MTRSFQEWAGDKKLKGLVLLVLALAAVALIAYTYLTVREGRYIYSGPTTISVRGTGEVARIPDIATFTFGVNAEASDPVAAQEKSAAAINDIMAYLKEEGVAEVDIKTTQYNLSPRYEFRQEACAPGFCPGGKSELVGYTVNQQITVKVRESEKAGSLVGGVGERGATNVSNIQFTVDDDSAAKAEAREKAVADAKEKAKQLADTLGVRLVRLNGFWEEERDFYPAYDSRGFGGAMSESMPVAPELPGGENTITSVVNLNYEIR